jgi:hypothetical protein
MDMLDALSEIATPGLWMWARPVSWKGSGMALCHEAANPPCSGEGWKLVPTLKGGQAAMLPSPKDVFGEWEVVTPQAVNQELGDAASR